LGEDSPLLIIEGFDKNSSIWGRQSRISSGCRTAGLPGTGDAMNEKIFVLVAYRCHGNLRFPREDAFPEDK